MVVAIFLSLLLLAGILWFVQREYRYKAACWFAAVGVVLGLCSGVKAIFLQSLFTLIVVSICWILRARPRTLLSSCVAAAMLGYGAAFYGPVMELRERERLRESFPLESVAHRLAYEDQWRATTTPLPEFLPLQDEVKRQLIYMEEQRPLSHRGRLLRYLHNRSVDRFIMEDGFGVTRRARLNPTAQRLVLPEPEAVPLPAPELDYEPEIQDDTHVVHQEQPAMKDTRVLPARHVLKSIHDSGLNDFLNPDRIGYVANRDNVAGFESHRFEGMPWPAEAENNSNEWQLARLDLMSLLKHEQPRVYVSRELPRMDALADAPTRPLDAFEEQALARLRYDEDLVVDESANRIRMLGSIRAQHSCLECHQTNWGELLGAFSYELRRIRPIPAPRKPLEPPI